MVPTQIQSGTEAKYGSEDMVVLDVDLLGLPFGFGISNE
jgi:hypothetical protein